jgi:hypothetical protein
VSRTPKKPRFSGFGCGAVANDDGRSREIRLRRSRCDRAEFGSAAGSHASTFAVPLRIDAPRNTAVVRRVQRITRGTPAAGDQYSRAQKLMDLRRSGGVTRANCIESPMNASATARTSINRATGCRIVKSLVADMAQPARNDARTR